MALRLAAIASLGAAIIHFAVAPTHWREWLPSGLFFVSIALFQVLWARIVLARPTATVLLAGILGNVGSAALWALSRTAGAPFGPRAGEAELVHGADLCALLLESYVVMGAGWVWYRGRQAESVPAFTNAMVLLGFGTVIASAATVGVASGLQDEHHHGPAAAESEHHTPVVGHDGGHQVGHHDHSVPESPPPTHEPAVPLNAPAPVPAPPPPVQPAHDDHGDHQHD